MGYRNLKAVWALSAAYIWIVFVCMLCFCASLADAAVTSKITAGLVASVVESAKLTEEINLSGATLAGITEGHAELSQLKQISLKTYRLKNPPDEAQIQDIDTAYTERLTSAGWQMAFRRIDEDRAVFLFGKQGKGMTESLVVVLVTPRELSEMFLLGDIKLTELDELRKVILQSMPRLDRGASLLENITPRHSRSQEMGDELSRLEKVVSKRGKQTPLEIRDQLAMHYQAIGNYADALKQYKFIISCSNAPEWLASRAYLGAAQCSKELGDLRVARKYYQSLLDRYGSRSGAAPMALESIRQLEKSGRQQSRPDMLMSNAISLLNANDYERAVEQYQIVLKEFPKSPYAALALRNMAAAYAGMKNREKEIETYKQLAEEYPSANTSLQLAEAYQRNGLCEKAVEVYGSFLEKYKDAAKWQFLDAHLNMGECLEKLSERHRKNGDLDGAAKLLGQAKEQYRIVLSLPGLQSDPRITSVQKKMLIMERGSDLPFLGLGFRHTGSIKGARIVTVFKNGPCWGTPISPGDTLVQIDSEPTPSPRKVIQVIGKKNIGDGVVLTVKHQEEKIQVPIVLAKTPKILER